MVFVSWWFHTSSRILRVLRGLRGEPSTRMRMMRAMTDAHPSDRERTSDAPALPVDPAVDRRVVEGQIGRSPRAMAGVSARCVFGMPAAAVALGASCQVADIEHVPAAIVSSIPRRASA